ncbi:MAG: DUF3786 domain-containing protein [Desulfobacteraceae bacterium]|nr:DUF3786 domain-containing protein [Desulfobacteraceae bacterium]
MLQFNNSMDIFRLLPKTNCKKCQAPTCLAFSVLVFKGDKQFNACPYIEEEIIEKFDGKIKKQKSAEQDFAEAVVLLKRKIAAIDLSLLAERLGGKFSNNKLTIKILGKDFSVDSKGAFSSDIHINQWIVIPVLNYILNGAGLSASGKWVPLRELAGGKKWYRLFGQRCEKPLKKIADTYTDLFEDMIDIFNGKQVENHYQSDISLVLHPLPKVPILICYWRAEDGLDSELNLFFDSNAEDNLNIESIYTLGTGLVLMFEKITLKHGFK